MANHLKTPAIAYLRTSSQTNVGEDKDSDKRQTAAIAGFASRSGFEIVDTYYDAAVSGADPLQDRPGFAALLKRIASNGVRTVIVEDASRFARELMVQEAGVLLLRALGVTLLTSRGDCMTEVDDELAVFRRQQDGSVAQLVKATIAKNLKQARDRKREANAKKGKLTKEGKGKCEGRKSIAEREPMAVARARELASVRKMKPSLRSIAATLATQGFLSSTGEPFTAKTIQSMLA